MQTYLRALHALMLAMLMFKVTFCINTADHSLPTALKILLLVDALLISWNARM